MQCLAAEVERLNAEHFGGRPGFFRDAEKLVVFADAIGTASRASLDLAGAGSNREVRDEGVFGLAGAVADDAGVPVASAEFEGFERLGDRANLIDLDQDGVRSEERRVGKE